MTLMVRNSKIKKMPPTKVEAKPGMTPAKRDAEEKRMAEMMYPTVAKKIQGNAPAGEQP